MQYIFARHGALFLRRMGVLLSTLLLTIALLMFQPAKAAGLIRDAEIEHTLRAYSDPIFEAAGLTPSAINIYIVNDNAINAFVMGGSNVFINTGLILKTESPEMLIGVLAHETGHIAGGHLIKTMDALERAKMQALISSLVGAAAMAGGAGDVGAAIMSAGQHSATRNMLSHSRSNERAADQAALRILDQLKISASGMLETFELLRRQETRKLGNPDPYAVTHPLSTERISHMRAHISQSDIPEGQAPASFDEMHQRMLGKLEGFLLPPDQVLGQYPSSNQTIRAHYARAVAYHRQAQVDRAVAELEPLIAASPSDPYYHELKGQILFESGRVQDALAAYEKAAELAPDSALIRTEVARALLSGEPGEPEVNEAIQHLQIATTTDKKNPSTWRLMATAQGRSGRMDLSHLALAEEALLLGEPERALKQLDIAKGHIKPYSPASLREKDLRQAAAKLKEDMKDNPQG